MAPAMGRSPVSRAIFMHSLCEPGTRLAAVRRTWRAPEGTSPQRSLLASVLRSVRRGTVVPIACIPHDRRRPRGRGGQARRHRRRSRPAPGEHARLARPRRSRGGWLRAARVEHRRAVGGGRDRGHDADVVRRRSPPGVVARRVPRDPQGRALPRVPAWRVQRDDGLARGRDGLVEIWNGMPFFSPLWSRTAHVTWLHHVHAEMWQMTLPPRLAAFGNFVESKLAPPLYHRTPIVTLSESSKRELVDDLGFRADRVSVVTPGIDPHYTPSGEKSPTPLVVAVGRLVPVKQFDVLIDALVALKPTHPDARGGHRGGGLQARGAREPAPRRACRELDPPARARRRGREGRPLPAGVDPGERVGARGLGHDDHGGGGVRYPRGRE